MWVPAPKSPPVLLGGIGFGIWGMVTPCKITLENTDDFFSFLKVFWAFLVQSWVCPSALLPGLAGGRASLARRSGRIRSDRQLAAKKQRSFSGRKHKADGIWHKGNMERTQKPPGGRRSWKTQELGSCVVPLVLWKVAAGGGEDIP